MQVKFQISDNLQMKKLPVKSSDTHLVVLQSDMARRCALHRTSACPLDFFARCDIARICFKCIEQFCIEQFALRSLYNESNRILIVYYPALLGSIPLDTLYYTRVYVLKDIKA